MSQLTQPGFIRLLCAHEAAHLVYFKAAGTTQYQPCPAYIKYDPEIDDYVGNLAALKILDLSPWQEGKFWEWFSIVAKAHAAGGVVARKLDPTTDGGDEDDKARFQALCQKLNQSTPGLSINADEMWNIAKQAVFEDLKNPQRMKIIMDQAAELRTVLGL